MSKFEEPFEDTQALYTQAISNAGLTNHVNITVLTNNKAKEIYKVNKANDLLNYRTGDDIIIVINEAVLEKLTPEQQVILVEESLASISYNSEADTIVISKPDVVTFSGLLAKHTFATWNTLRESIKSVYDAIKQEEDERKAATEKAKKKPNFQKA
jgi:TRAP-type C4-dicarboxylate transport system substrate-binding protein